MPRRPPKLVLSKIDIPIRRNKHRIRPSDPRIPHKHSRHSTGRIEDVDCILFKVSGIDESIRIRFYAIGNPNHAVGNDGCLCQQF